MPEQKVLSLKNAKPPIVSGWSLRGASDSDSDTVPSDYFLVFCENASSSEFPVIFSIGGVAVETVAPGTRGRTHRCRPGQRVVVRGAGGGGNDTATGNFVYVDVDPSSPRQTSCQPKKTIMSDKKRNPQITDDAPAQANAVYSQQQANVT